MILCCRSVTLWERQWGCLSTSLSFSLVFVCMCTPIGVCLGWYVTTFLVCSRWRENPAVRFRQWIPRSPARFPPTRRKTWWLCLHVSFLPPCQLILLSVCKVSEILSQPLWYWKREKKKLWRVMYTSRQDIRDVNRPPLAFPPTTASS